MAEMPTISVEAVAFEALKRLAQDIYDKHGVALTSVHINWRDDRTHGGTVNRMSVTEVEASMRKP